MISWVDKVSLNLAWGALEPQIKRAFNHAQGDQMSPEGLREDVRRGDSQMWVAHEGEDIQAGMVFTMNEHENGKTIVVELLAGQGRGQWADELESKLVEYRDLVGAQTIEAAVRPGAAKIMLGRGWRSKAEIVELRAEI